MISFFIPVGFLEVLLGICSRKSWLASLAFGTE
jgi:hypothetical protein